MDIKVAQYEEEFEIVALMFRVHDLNNHSGSFMWANRRDIANDPHLKSCHEMSDDERFIFYFDSRNNV